MTDLRCKELIDASGISRNPMKGISGSFYTGNRQRDLFWLIIEIIKERTK